MYESKTYLKFLLHTISVKKNNRSVPIHNDTFITEARKCIRSTLDLEGKRKHVSCSK